MLATDVENNNGQWSTYHADTDSDDTSKSDSSRSREKDAVGSGNASPRGNKTRKHVNQNKIDNSKRLKSDGFETPQKGVSKNQSTPKQSSQVNRNFSMQFLWVMLDGIGLSIVAASTVLEGFELWETYLKAYYENNFTALVCWATGNSMQVLGLLFLVMYAASFMSLHYLEYIGMGFLTVGPMLNMIASLNFQTGTESNLIYNLHWFTGECVELLGIVFLDLSFLPLSSEFFLLALELVGFIFLCMAAMLEYDYTAVLIGESYAPEVDYRLARYINCFECFGLIILSIVSTGQYVTKLHKDEKSTYSL